MFWKCFLSQNGEFSGGGTDDKKKKKRSEVNSAASVRIFFLITM